MSVSKKIQDDATLRLLKVLGELTPDLEINNATTAMNVAYVRIRRLEEELSDSRQVFAVNYGNPDMEEDITHRLYSNLDLAVEHAIDAAKEVLNDNPEISGYTIESHIPDSNGNPFILIKTPEPNSRECEWWRVVPMKVWEK